MLEKPVTPSFEAPKKDKPTPTHGLVQGVHQLPQPDGKVVDKILQAMEAQNQKLCSFFDHMGKMMAQTSRAPATATSASAPAPSKKRKVAAD